MRRTLAEASYLVMALLGFASLVIALPLIGWLDFTRWLRAERQRRSAR